MQSAILPKPFDGHNLRPVRARRRHQTGHDGIPIQEDLTRAAFPLRAPFLGAGQANILAQKPQQRFLMAGRHHVTPAVDCRLYRRRIAAAMADNGRKGAFHPAISFPP